MRRSLAGGPVDSTSADRLALVTGQILRGWMKIGREEARQLDLSLPQLFVLGGLQELGEVPITRWAEIVGSSPSATTGLLDGLETSGYVRRTHDRQDRRRVLISLTPAGRRLTARLHRQSRDRWRIFCEGIPRGDLERATRILSRIYTRLDAAHGVASLTSRASPARSEGT